MLKGFNFIRNIGTSYISVIITSLIGLYSIPLAINHFDTETYGIWLLVSSIIAYLAISNFGIPTSSGAMIAKSSSASFQKQIVIKSFLALSLVSAFVALMLFFVNEIYPDWLYLFGRFDKANEVMAKSVFIIMIIGFLFRVPLQIALTAFTALQKMYISKSYELGLFILNFVMLLIVVNNKHDLITLAILTVLGNVLVNLIALFHLFISHRKIDKGTETVRIKKIFSNGFPFFYIGIVSTIVWSTDNIVISHFIGLEEIVTYSIAFKLFTTGFILFTTLSGIMFPMYGKFYSLNQWMNVQKVYDLNLIVLPFIASAIWLGGVLFGKEIILLWTGKVGLFGGYLLFFALGGYGFILSIVNTHANLLSGLNLVRNTVKVSWLEAVLNVTISILLAHKFGIAGVALGTLLASFLGPFLFLPYFINLNTNRQVHSDKFKYIKLFFIVGSAVMVLSGGAIFYELDIPQKCLIFIAYISIYFFIQRSNIFSSYKLIRAS